MARRIVLIVALAAYMLPLMASPAAAETSRLTNNVATDLGPKYSPQGDRIAFLSDRRGGPFGFDVFVMNQDGTGVTNISCPDGGCDVLPAAQRPLNWSPNSARVIFADDRAEIYTASVNGAGLTKVSQDGIPATRGQHPVYSPEHPVYSPNGTKIYMEQGNQIARMNADGTSPEQLVEGVNFDLSTDGSKIAYACLGLCPGGIRVANADGSGITQVTNNEHDNFPIFSPDGDQLIFSRDFPSDQTADLFRIDVDGTNLTRLTNDGRINGSGFMDWSNDGTKIAYEWGTAQNSFGAAIVNVADGSSRQDVGTAASDDGDPSFSADSTTLAYFSDQDDLGNIDIYKDTVFTATSTVAPLGSVSTDDGSGATPSDPTTTTVFTYTGGTVSIQETDAITTAAPPDFELIGQQVNIEAPAGTAATPLGITFRLDASVIPAGENETTVQVFRNGVLVPGCSGLPGVASPDPCVSVRRLLEDGDVELEVLTSEASAWNFGVQDTPPYLPGQMSGAGTLTGDDGQRVAHLLHLQCDKTRGPNRLEINAGSDGFSLLQLTEATCRDDPSVGRPSPGAGFDTYSGEGTGTLNGLPATAEWVFVDAGEPGRNDFGRIVVRDALGNVAISASGQLTAGNYQAKR